MSDDCRSQKYIGQLCLQIKALTGSEFVCQYLRFYTGGAGGDVQGTLRSFVRTPSVCRYTEREPERSFCTTPPSQTDKQTDRPTDTLAN